MCDSYTDLNFVVKTYFFYLLKEQWKEEESFDRLLSLPVQAFPKVDSKIFHSVFSQKQFWWVAFLFFGKLFLRRSVYEV